MENTARNGAAINNTGYIDLIVGWERTRWKSAPPLSLMHVAMNCSFCLAIPLTMNFPTVPGFGLGSPMSTNIRVLCYPLNCRRDTLALCSSSGRAASPQLALTSGQPKAFRQHFARGGHSLSLLPETFRR